MLSRRRPTSTTRAKMCIHKPTHTQPYTHTHIHTCNTLCLYTQSKGCTNSAFAADMLSRWQPSSTTCAKMRTHIPTHMQPYTHTHLQHALLVHAHKRVYKQRICCRHTEQMAAYINHTCQDAYTQTHTCSLTHTNTHLQHALLVHVHKGAQTVRQPQLPSS